MNDPEPDRRTPARRPAAAPRDAGELDADPLQDMTFLIPVLNEELTIAQVIGEVRRVSPTSRVVVADSGSTDRTVAMAEAAGGEVVEVTSLAPFGPVLGKGDALWRCMPLVTTEFVTFLDGDIYIDGPSFIRPMLDALRQDGVVFSKASFQRVRLHDGTVEPGRVTQLVARPLLATHFPDLSSLDEPLSGQIAAPTSLLRSLPFECDYGLEVGMLIDVYRRFGLAGIAHPPCGRLSHVSQADGPIRQMADQVSRSVLWRAGVLPGGHGMRPAPKPVEGA